MAKATQKKEEPTKQAETAPIITYKGFDKDLKCRGFQYAIGESYEHDGAVKACNAGFHACEHPLNVFEYYAPAGNRFAAVEQSGELSRHDGDTKVASSKITIKAEIGIPGLVKAAVEYVTSRCEPVDTDSPAYSTGYQGAPAAPATTARPAAPESILSPWPAGSQERQKHPQETPSCCATAIPMRRATNTAESCTSRRRLLVRTASGLTFGTRSTRPANSLRPMNKPPARIAGFFTSKGFDMYDIAQATNDRRAPWPFVRRRGEPSPASEPTATRRRRAAAPAGQGYQRMRAWLEANPHAHATARYIAREADVHYKTAQDALLRLRSQCLAHSVRISGPLMAWAIGAAPCDTRAPTPPLDIN